MTVDTAPVTQPFQAEVSELLNLMVHSVYSETDIFLRELISNASDACDKLRYEAIARPELLGDGGAPNIRIAANKAAGTLTVADTGIGMDRQELVDNLGTIARSGTKAFVAKLAEAKDGSGLIGQFGVGFYSAFMVADRISVTSRHAGSSEVWTWSSSGGAGFEVAPAAEADAGRVARGTEIVLHLKDDAKKYLETYEIERIVGAWSDNIQFPIELFPNTRWIKGYMITGAVNLRHPLAYLKVTGLGGVVGLFGLILGTPAAFLLYPVVLALTVITYVGVQVIKLDIPQWLLITGLIDMVVGNLLMIVMTALAAERRYGWRIAAFSVFNPVYWCLHATAAWRALYQLVRKPHMWEKTPHGLSEDHETDLGDNPGHVAAAAPGGGAG